MVLHGRVGELADHDPVARDVEDVVAGRAAVVDAVREVEGGRAQLREDVVGEGDAVGVRGLDAGRRTADELVVGGVGRNVVVAALGVEVTVVGGLHPGGLGEGDPGEAQVVGGSVEAGALDVEERLERGRLHGGGGHVLAGAGLVVDGLRGRVDVELTRFVEELVGVLEVQRGAVGELRPRALEQDARFVVLDGDIGGAVGGADRLQPQVALAPLRLQHHLDLVEVGPVGDLRAEHLQQLVGAVAALQLEVGAGVGVAGAGGADSVDVQLPEVEGADGRLVLAVGGRGPAGDRLAAGDHGRLAVVGLVDDRVPVGARVRGAEGDRGGERVAASAQVHDDVVGHVRVDGADRGLGGLDGPERRRGTGSGVAVTAVGGVDVEVRRGRVGGLGGQRGREDGSCHRERLDRPCADAQGAHGGSLLQVGSYEWYLSRHTSSPVKTIDMHIFLRCNTEDTGSVSGLQAANVR